MMPAIKVVEKQLVGDFDGFIVFQKKEGQIKYGVAPNISGFLYILISVG